MHKVVPLVAEVIAAGAAVYAVKTATPDDLAAAVRQTLEHSIFYARPRHSSTRPDRCE